MLDRLLIYRLIIINLCGVAMVATLWQRGMVETLFEEDATRLTYVIVALFLVGMVSVFRRGIKLSKTLNDLKRYRVQRPRDLRGLIGFNPEKFAAKTAHIEDICKWLVLLGLLGTVIGFRWSLSGIDTNSFSSASGTQASLIVMLGGVFIAQGTTIVSIATALWLDINRRILATAIVLATEDSR